MNLGIPFAEEFLFEVDKRLSGDFFSCHIHNQTTGTNFETKLQKISLEERPFSVHLTKEEMERIAEILFELQAEGKGLERIEEEAAFKLLNLSYIEDDEEREKFLDENPKTQSELCDAYEKVRFVNGLIHGGIFEEPPSYILTYGRTNGKKKYGLALLSLLGAAIALSVFIPIEKERQRLEQLENRGLSKEQAKKFDSLYSKYAKDNLFTSVYNTTILDFATYYGLNPIQAEEALNGCKSFEKANKLLYFFVKLPSQDLTKDTINYFLNLTAYYDSIGKNIFQNFEEEDIVNAISIIQRYPEAYRGLSCEFPLIGRDADVFTALVKANSTATELAPYITWALSKKGSHIIDLINRKSQAVIDYQGNIPRRKIDFDMRNNYGTNTTYLHLLNERRNEIINAYNEGLWLIGIKPEEILKLMNNSKISADVTLLHTVLPFSLISGDSLRGNWLYFLYPEELSSNPEKIVLLTFSNNLEAMEIFRSIYRDYERGNLTNLTSSGRDIDTELNSVFEYFKNFNFEAARDMQLLYNNGSKIFKYGYIAKSLPTTPYLPNYGLPGISGETHEEFRVSMAMTIGASIGVPVYGGDYFCANGSHGLAFPIILHSDYQKLMEIDNSQVVYDPLTLAFSVYMTRKDANYFTTLTGKKYEPFVKRWRLTSFPINDWRRIIYEVENSSREQDEGV